MKYYLIILSIGLLGFSYKNNMEDRISIEEYKSENQLMTPVKYDKQIEVFKSLGYEFSEGVTKEMILRDVFEMTWEDETERHIEENPYSILYYIFGWRDPNVPKYNYSEKCIWFDLEFFDPNSQYKWFMERMGAITNGEINFEEISITTDDENWEWIELSA